MADSMGHKITGLVDIHEKKPTELGLFSERQWGDGSGIYPTNARLTALGIKVCENINNYQIVIRELDRDPA
jgi:hypothetical protein